MHFGFRRSPAPADLTCPVCTGIVAAGSTALVLDLMEPARAPAALVTMHAACYPVLQTTVEAVLLKRASPNGPALDHEGAIAVVHAGVRFRVTGERRTRIADKVREAIATYQSGPASQPIVAFVRRYVTVQDDGAVVTRVTETPGPPPHMREQGEPHFTVTFETAAPNRHAAVLARFDFRPHNTSIDPRSPRYLDTVAELQAFICQRADAGIGHNGIADDLRRLPRVTGVQDFTTGSPNGISYVTVDPMRAAPASRQHGATTNQGPPAGDFAGVAARQARGVHPALANQRKRDDETELEFLHRLRRIAADHNASLSPTDIGDNQGDNPGGGGAEIGAGGGAVLPVGEVTRPMLQALDTPESIAARPAIATTIRTGLVRAFPTVGISDVRVERSPATLAETVIVSLRRRVIDSSPAHMAATFSANLRDRVPSWAALEAAGLSLTVIDEPPPTPGPDGAQAADEVDLRGIPKHPSTFGSTANVGSNVAFRFPLWRMVFPEVNAPGEGERVPAQTRALLEPHQDQLGRIRNRFKELLKGLSPLQARTGTLAAYDAVTDHALVRVTLPQGDIYIHASLSWTMEWNVPSAPQPTTSLAAAAAVVWPTSTAPGAQLATIIAEDNARALSPTPVPAPPVDVRDTFAAELRRRAAVKATIGKA